MHPLARKLAEFDPDGHVTVRWVIDELERAEEVAPSLAVPWLSLREAAGILYDAPTEDDLRVLRARCARWHRMQLQGRRPKIRVRKAGPSERSPWELCPEDVWAEAERTEQTGPRLVRDVPDEPLRDDEPLDEDRLAALCVHAVTRNLRRG